MGASLARGRAEKFADAELQPPAYKLLRAPRAGLQVDTDPWDLVSPLSGLHPRAPDCQRGEPLNRRTRQSISPNRARCEARCRSC